MTAFDKLQVNQHLSLNLHGGENRKMSKAFRKNDNSPGNADNCFNTIGSFNNNDIRYNNNTDSFNKYIYNTTVDDRSEVLTWLSPLEPRLRHRDIASRRVDSIGAWLLETEEFKRWYKGDRGDESYHRTLFCDGNPGVGKSYIT